MLALTAMRTLTEFPGVILRLVSKTKATLAASGTAEDQIATEVGTAHKIEGDRLNHMMKALSLIGEKLEKVARVRVLSGEDATKMPQGSVKEGEVFFHIEYLPEAKKAHSGGKDKGGRFGKDGKKGGKGKRDGKGGGRRDRNDRGGRDRKDGGNSTPKADA